jgi:hypothetical protein
VKAEWMPVAPNGKPRLERYPYGISRHRIECTHDMRDLHRVVRLGLPDVSAGSSRRQVGGVDHSSIRTPLSEPNDDGRPAGFAESAVVVSDCRSSAPG